MPVPAILLAAGASRRLGQPKQLVPICGETLLARTVRLTLEAGAEPVLVVVGAHRESVLVGVDLRRVTVVQNPAWEQGIASSIRAGLDALIRLLPDADAAMMLVCDQPKLSAEHLSLLMERRSSGTIVASQYAGIAGIPAIFPASQFPRLMALEGDAGARFLLRKPECAMVLVDLAGGEEDIDTPEDMTRLGL